MKTSIRAKIMIFSSALLICIVVLQLVFGLFLSKTFFVEQRKSEIATLYETIKTNYTDSPFELSTLTEKAENIYNIKITVFDSDSIVYSTKQSSDGFEFFGQPFLFHEGLMPQREPNMPPVDFSTFEENPKIVDLDGSGRSLALQGKFDYMGEERYAMLWTSVESIDSSVAMFTRVNFGISVVIMFAGLICAFFVAKSINKPIKNIENVSKKIASLDFGERADETVGTPEISSLAESINIMSAKLKGTIDELQAANENLNEDINYQKRIERMQREFIGNVSHEMKTPLCLLQMYGENLKNDVDGIDKEYYCQTIIDETMRLNDMVKDMLQISTIENELFNIEKQTVDISKLCRYTVSKMDIFLKETNCVCEIDDGILVNGDEKYLEQAMKNYLSNAATHTEKGKKIVITLKAENKMAVFSVFNEGSTIEPEKLPLIWDRFYKADESRVRSEGVHAGLGLSIVKAVIDKHGGNCFAENRKDGIEFSFELPLI